MMKAWWILVLLVSCGKGSDDNASQSESMVMSMAVTTADDLPACTEANQNQLVYVTTDEVFQTCDDEVWAVIEVKGADGKDGSNGADGLSISEIWRYHTDTFASAADLSSEGIIITYIGTIQLIKFSDDSTFVSVQGITLDDDDAGDIFNSQFSDSFYLPASTSDQTYISKLKGYANTRIRYKILDSYPSSFGAVVDADGSFSDNTDSWFTLVKQ